MFDQDLERVLRWYRARGYYAAKVVGVEFDPPEAAEPSRAGRCDPEREQCTVDIRVRIQEGEPVRVTELRLRGTQGLPGPLLERLQRALTLVRGQRFDEAVYEDGKAALRQELKAVGHAAAKAEGRVRLDTKARSAMVEYEIAPGPIYRFGGLRVTGQRNLPTAPIVAAAGLTPGTRYDPEVLREIQAEVFALGAFSSVELEEKLNEASQRVDVAVRVTPLAPDQLRVGIGVLSGANRRTETSELTSIPQWDIHLFGSYERRHAFGTLGRVRIDERPRLIENRDFPRFTTPEFGNVVGIGFNQPGLLEPRTDAFSRSEWDFGPDPFLGFRRSDVFVRVGARRAFFEEVGFRQNTDGPVVRIHHRERLEMGGRGGPLGGRQRLILPQRDELLVNHVLHGNRGAAKHRRRGGVVRRTQQRHTLLRRVIEHGLGNGQAARDNDGADVVPDGQILDLEPVADHDNQLLAIVVAEPLRERFEIHCAYHQHEILFLVSLHAKNDFRPQGRRKVFDRGQHSPGIEQAAGRREKKLGHLKHRDQPLADPIIQHGKDADVALIHHPERIGDGGGGRHANHLRDHDITDLGRDIRHKSRRRHAESLEHEVDAVVGVAAARRDGAGQTGTSLEFCIAEGRADRVGIGIPVSND